MTNSITRINGVEISAVFENGEVFIPVKPVCEAIGIAFPTQFAKIQEHPILGSVVTLRVTTGADGKRYEMACLPLRYVYGWLFTINPANVAEPARDHVVKYHRECYDALYEHFSSAERRQREANEAERYQLRVIEQSIETERNARAVRKEAEAALFKIRAERLDPVPSLF